MSGEPWPPFSAGRWEAGVGWDAPRTCLPLTAPRRRTLTSGTILLMGSCFTETRGSCVPFDTMRTRWCGSFGACWLSATP